MNVSGSPRLRTPHSRDDPAATQGHTGPSGDATQTSGDATKVVVVIRRPVLPFDRRPADDPTKVVLTPRIKLVTLMEHIGVQGNVLSRLTRHANWTKLQDATLGRVSLRKTPKDRTMLALEGMKWLPTTMVTLLVGMKQFGPACKFLRMCAPSTRSRALDVLLCRGIEHIELGDAEQDWRECVVGTARRLFTTQGPSGRQACLRLLGRCSLDLQHIVLADLLRRSYYYVADLVDALPSQDAARRAIERAVQEAKESTDPNARLTGLAWTCSRLRSRQLRKHFAASLQAACDELGARGRISKLAARSVAMLNSAGEATL